MKLALNKKLTIFYLLKYLCIFSCLQMIEISVDKNKGNHSRPRTAVKGQTNFDTELSLTSNNIGAKFKCGINVRVYNAALCKVELD